MDRLTKRTIVLALATSLAILLSGMFGAVNAQSEISCCLTKKGKLKNCELGENTRKECKKNQTVVTMQLSDQQSAADCAAGGVSVGGACWFYGKSNASCDDTCAGVGLTYDQATETYSGSGGTLDNCQAVMKALGQLLETISPFNDQNCSEGYGCVNFTDIQEPNTRRCTAPETVSNAPTVPTSSLHRACACGAS